MNIIWMGLVVPPELGERLSAADRYITVQAQRFQRSVIDAIEHGGQFKVDIVASPPMTDWCAIKFVGLVRWSHAGNSSDWVVPTLNIPVAKQLCVFLGCLALGIARIVCRGRRDTLILVGDSYFPHLLASWIAGGLCGVKTIAFVTDVPGLIAVPDPWYKRLLRPFDNWSVRSTLAKHDGLIVLSSHIATDLFPGKPAITIPAILDRAALEVADGHSPDDDVFTIMYSGALLEEYGISLLLAAFALLPGDGYRLWICGKGHAEKQVQSAASRDPRISFLGYVSNEEMKIRLAKSNVLICLRVAHDGHARYSFPSKLAAYMAVGRFVVVNRFPSLPETYARELIVIESDTAEALAAALQSIRFGREGDLTTVGARCREFIRREASEEMQGRRIADFIAKVHERAI
jgi:glycosyltransferase involved in cell wall biosynthesis